MSQRWIRGGTIITPSGANLISMPGGSVTTFSVGSFSSAAYDARLAQMQARGFNAVRQFAWMPNAGMPGGTGLNPAYVANVATGIKLAFDRGLYTILSCGGIPGTIPTTSSSGAGGYYPQVLDPGYLAVGANWLYFTANGTNGQSAALSDLLTMLLTEGVTEEMLLAIEFTGEMAFDTTAFPFTAGGGVPTGSGSYTFPAQAQAAMDANILRFIAACHARIKAVMPNTPSMVAMNPANAIVSPTLAVPSAVVLSTPAAMDAIGFSFYPETLVNVDITLPTLIADLGAPLPQTKYLTILETGYTIGQTGTLSELANNLVSWQRTACAYGIYGLSFFTWDSSHADTAAATGTAYYNMLDGNAEFATALSPHHIGDGCGSNNASLAPLLATNKIRAKFYAPGLVPGTDPPTVTLTNILDWRVVMGQINRFDGHQLTIAETDARQIKTMPPRTTVVIEQSGIGDIAEGIVEAPEQQVRDTGEGQLMLDLPNITTQGLNVSTGMGYVAEGPIRDLVAGLGALRTKSRSVFRDPTTPYILTAGSDVGKADTVVTNGRDMGWSATFVEDGSYMDATAPVVWDVLGNSEANGNSVKRTFGAATAYDGSGANGTPGHTAVATHTSQLNWQIVVPTIAQVGLRGDRAVTSPEYGFDFSAPHIDPISGLWVGTYTIIAGGAGTGTPGVYPSNTAFAVKTLLINGALSVQWLVEGQMVYQNAFSLPPALYPVAYIAQVNGEVSNAQYTRNVPSSEAWFQLTFDKASQPAALIQTADNTGMFVRQGANADGSPKRTYEFGKLGTSSGITLRDCRGGLYDSLRANKNLRMIREISSYKVDATDCFTVTTPLGGGTGDAQVDLELLWRILNDVTYENFQNRRGGYQNVFPEYDTSFSINRDGSNGRYEYYVVYEPAFAPIGFAAWLAQPDYQLPASSLGYIEGGSAALSQFVYPDTANLAQKEAVQRLLYFSTMEQLKRAVVPHITIQLTTIGDWRPPRAGDRVHIDYTRPASDKDGTPWAPEHIVTGTDALMNPDPRVVKWERQAGSDDIPIDTVLLSNLGRYEDTVASQLESVSRQVAQIQLATQNKINVSHFNMSFDNIDYGHPIEFPLYMLSTMFSVDAFFLFIATYPFRQPIAPDGNTDLYFNPPGTHIYVTVGGIDIPLPVTNDFSTESAPIADVPKHFHSMRFFGGVSQTPTATTKYLYAQNTQEPALVVVNNGPDINLYTEDKILKIDTAPTTHPHPVAKKGQSLIHIPKTTALADLPQHYHPLPPGIKDLERASGILLEIAGPDGIFMPVTAKLVDVLGGPDPTAEGFAQQFFMVEIARFVNFPGRLPIVRIKSQNNAAYGRSRVGYGGTIMENIGGLGSFVQERR